MRSGVLVILTSCRSLSIVIGGRVGVRVSGVRFLFICRAGFIVCFFRLSCSCFFWVWSLVLTVVLLFRFLRLRRVRGSRGVVGWGSGVDSFLVFFFFLGD